MKIKIILAISLFLINIKFTNAKLSINDVYKYQLALNESLCDAKSSKTVEKSIENNDKNGSDFSLINLDLMNTYNCSYFIENIRNFFIGMELGYNKKEKKREYKHDKPAGNDLLRNSVIGRISGLLRLLFPSPSGVLSLSANADYSKILNDFMTPKEVANLFAIFLNQKNTNKKEYSNWDTKKFFEEEEQESLVKYIHDSIAFVANNGSQNEKQILNVMLLVYTLEKFNTFNELLSFCEEIEKSFSINNFVKNLLKHNEKFSIVKEENLKVLQERINNIENKEPNISPEEAMSLLSSFINLHSYLYNNTPYSTDTIISNDYANYVKEDGSIPDNSLTFPDCAEVAIRHVCNYMFFDRTKRLFVLPNFITENKNSNLKTERLKKFYEIQTLNDANNGSITMRTDWNRVVSHVKNARYREVGNSPTSYNEIYPGFVNMLVILHDIIGEPLSNEKIENFYSFIGKEKNNIDKIKEEISKMFQYILCKMSGTSENDIELQFLGLNADNVFHQKNQYDLYGELEVTNVKNDFKFKISHVTYHAQVSKIGKDNPDKKQTIEKAEHIVKKDEKLKNLLWLIIELHRNNNWFQYIKSDENFDIFKIYGLAHITCFESKIDLLLSLSTKKDYKEYNSNSNKTIEIVSNKIDFMDESSISSIGLFEAFLPKEKYKELEKHINKIHMHTKIFDYSKLKIMFTNNNEKLLYNPSMIFVDDQLSLTYSDIKKDDLRETTKKLEAFNKIKINSSLKNLTLEGFRENHLERIIEIVKSLNSLEILALKNCTIEDEQAEILGECLKNNLSIKKLDLSYNEITNKGMKYILSSLYEHKIESINFHYNGILDKSNKKISEFLTNNKSIKSLYFSRNEIGDKFAKKIAIGLKNNESLKILDLNQNSIGDKGAIAIFESLPEKASLEDLNLNRNLLTIKSANHIYKLLNKTKTGLLYLSLYDNKDINYYAIDRIEEKLKKLKEPAK